MQKRKLMIIALSLYGASPVYAAATTEVKPAEQIVNGSVATQPVAPEVESPMQGHIIDLMEKDFNYESEQRSLSQQLSLEKLRSELRKLRGEQSMPAQSGPISTTASGFDTELDNAAISMTAPEIRALLLSEIAGQKKVAVSTEGGQVKMVNLNQSFVYNGYRYIARQTRGDIIAVEELKK